MIKGKTTITTVIKKRKGFHDDDLKSNPFVESENGFFWGAVG